MAPAHMIRISANLMRRSSIDFSYLSASWPAIAENRKNGRINRARPTLFSVLTLTPVTTPVAISRISAWRNTLSLNAPRNWVKKKSEKRFDVIRSVSEAFMGVPCYYSVRECRTCCSRRVVSGAGDPASKTVSYQCIYPTRRRHLATDLQLTGHGQQAYAVHRTPDGARGELDLFFLFLRRQRSQLFFHQPEQGIGLLPVPSRHWRIMAHRMFEQQLPAVTIVLRQFQV